LSWQPPETSCRDILKSIRLIDLDLFLQMHSAPETIPWTIRITHRKRNIWSTATLPLFAQMEESFYGDIMLNFEPSAPEEDIAEMS